MVNKVVRGKVILRLRKKGMSERDTEEGDGLESWKEGV